MSQFRLVMLLQFWVPVAIVAVIGLSGRSPGREVYLGVASSLGVACGAARVRAGSAAVGVLGVAVIVGACCWIGQVSWGLTLALVLNAAGAGAFGVLGARTIEMGARTNFVQRRIIEVERQRSERLLLNVLPRAIADRLKGSPAAIADSFDEVSVLFADIVGFTALSAKLSPGDLVVRLNELFTEFDRLADLHGVEKIKTIGDAYMAAAGVPAQSERGAESLAEMSLEMVEAVKRLGAGLEIRVGIHTGPVVAGVIGTRKFSYDLWGATVNTAARMESHGIAGKVQLSEATRNRLGARFRCERRGAIEVKGMGQVTTWFLLGPVPPTMPG